MSKPKAKCPGEEDWFIGTKFQNLGLEGTEVVVLLKENTGDKVEDLVVANMVIFNLRFSSMDDERETTCNFNLLV